MDKVYLFIFFYVGIVGVILRSRMTSLGVDNKYGSHIRRNEAFLIMIIPLLLIGFRTYVADTTAYINIYNSFNKSLPEIFNNAATTKGVGWEIYEWLIKRLTNNASVFLLITALIQGFIIARLYYRHSNDFAYSILLFFLSMTFYDLMNGMRQMMSVTLIFLFYDDIVKGRTIKFLIVILIAASIHSAALIWIPAYFVVRGNPFSWKIQVTLVMTVIIILFVNRFTSILGIALESSLYSGYTEQFAQDDGANFAHTLIMGVPVLLAYSMKKRLKEDKNISLNIMINLSALSFMVSLISNFTSGILIGRLPVYFNLTNYALLPILFDKLIERNSSTIRLACTLGYSMYGIFYLYATGIYYHSSILKFLN